ncbi:MAG: STAS domain-containing protein [Thermoleophilia bacterium]
MNLDRPDGVVVIGLAGEVDVFTAGEFRDVLLRAIDTGAQRVVVDAGSVTFMDSTGLGVFICGEKRLRLRGGRLVIACHEPRIERLFRITGLDGILSLRGTREEALQLAAQ